MKTVLWVALPLLLLVLATLLWPWLRYLMVALRMSGSLSFRNAGAGDIDAVVALVESAYRGDVSRQGWTTEADLLDGRRTGADDVAACLSGRAAASCWPSAMAPAGVRARRR